jgi:hypothetical protein
MRSAKRFLVAYGNRRSGVVRRRVLTYRTVDKAVRNARALVRLHGDHSVWVEEIGRPASRPDIEVVTDQISQRANRRQQFGGP